MINLDSLKEKLEAGKMIVGDTRLITISLLLLILEELRLNAANRAKALKDWKAHGSA